MKRNVITNKWKHSDNRRSVSELMCRQQCWWWVSSVDLKLTRLSQVRSIRGAFEVVEGLCSYCLRLFGRKKTTRATCSNRELGFVWCLVHCTLLGAVQRLVLRSCGSTVQMCSNECFDANTDCWILSVRLNGWSFRAVYYNAWFAWEPGNWWKARQERVCRSNCLSVAADSHHWFIQCLWSSVSKWKSSKLLLVSKLRELRCIPLRDSSLWVEQR